ncbi:DUF6620 family protein [Maribacter sp. 2307ULW6-5]|uniref:DUF6620 family protein n=1 Tax=Maribacter sp. 2307ULW6-5 TaxID=3386275 RepID=UPI0039BC4AD9
MEAINGVTFEDWGAACGNLAAGMSEEEVCKVLGIELPVWQKTNEEWSNKLGDLMAEDMSVATTYGNFFTNPKVGKFAGESADVPSLEDLLAKFPDYDSYLKVSVHQTQASQHGVDPTSVIESYGLNLQTWGQLNMHYMDWYHNYVQNGTEGAGERHKELEALRTKWETLFKEEYKNDAVDLGGDIDF